jgi:murein L,D-transpeptidase YafK
MRKGFQKTIAGFFILAGFCTASPAVADAGWSMADRVIVKKSERKLYLMLQGEILREFEINLGLVPNGDKIEEGDFKTPEGSYLLDGKNLNSEFFLSIKISYPDFYDAKQAQTNGVDPGGNIMIHGQPNNPRKSRAYYENYDWTNGCIAVSNADMIDIWLMTEDNTPIEILP